MPGSLSARDISKSYAGRAVLERVSLTVSPGDRVGVVGPNGIGKSTLLRVLAAIEVPDGGRVAASGAVGYLPQEVEAAPGETVLEHLARRAGVGAAGRDVDDLGARLAAEPELVTAHAEALERFLALGGADFDARARTTLADLGLPGRAGAVVSTLCGGEAARVSLAAILLARFDVFLLDEPTNNLDFAGLERLEGFLDGPAAGVVLVSHDREFLDRTVTRVVELEAETGRMREYAGTWSEYAAARERARAAHEVAYAGYAEERDRFEQLLAARRTQARGGGAMADRRGTQALRSRVKQAKTRIAGLDEVDKPWSPWELKLELPPAPPAGLLVELQGAVAERGVFRLGPVDLVLHSGDRLAVVGRNGSGKSTLLGALLGTLPLAAGSRRTGPAVVFGELDEARAAFSGALLADFVAASGLEATEAQTLLAKFGLGAEDVDRPAPGLSPGERTRAALALLVARPPVPRAAGRHSYDRAVTIDELRPEHWPEVARIYEDGLDLGTFEDRVPSWDDWHRSHLAAPRLVLLDGGALLGWAALAPFSARACYRGVVENSVYVARAARGRGVGRALLEELVRRADASGIWTIQAGILAGNDASVALHERCGFRVVGTRERIARKNGEWRDVVLMERRSAVVA
ncbi:MAG TPA: GNAT family N-acetyltransferase [Gaiellaceae bacterium]|nr:GNAT family N-acetyltransferase [Gaiellaceae bacterium]